MVFADDSLASPASQRDRNGDSRSTIGKAAQAIIEEILVLFADLPCKTFNPDFSFVRNSASLYFTVGNMSGCDRKLAKTELYGSRQKAKDIY